MYPLITQKHVHNIPRTLTFYSNLINLCLTSKSLNLTKLVHGHLIKLGLNANTFLGNRCLQLYGHFNCSDDIVNMFDDIIVKNNISWNVCLKGLLNCGRIVIAHKVFDEMTQRDVVSWNSLISWYVSCGFGDVVWDRFREMVCLGVKPSGYTYSMVVAMVCDQRRGKELHCGMIRSGLLTSNVVVGNSLVDMYGRVGMIEYAFGVFLCMEDVDVISWNSLIVGCCRTGFAEMGLSQFTLMRRLGYSVDEFTCSAVITCCTNLQNLEKGEQVFSHCIKAGYLSNSIISSAIIDLFSKCDRLVHSIQFFEELYRRDSAVCTSMISGYASHDMGENSIQLLVLMLRDNIRPTEFTISSVLASICGISEEQGTQFHALVVKLGFELDCVVCSSLVDMYAKLGLIDHAMQVFASMSQHDLVSWNTMILGLTRNGKIVEAIQTFKELHRRGSLPDQLSLEGLLLACTYGGFLDEGIAIFSKMEECYGITPCYEHYVSLVDILSQMGMLDEAIELAERMAHLPNAAMWETVLDACIVHGSMRHAEKVASRMVELEPHLTLPYRVLARIYEIKGQWEDIVRVKETMKRLMVKKVAGCSCISLGKHVYSITAEQLHFPAGRDIYSILRLITWEESELTLLKKVQADID